MLTNPNVGNSPDASQLTFAAKDLQGLTAFVSWKQVAPVDLSELTSWAEPTYHIFPLNADTQSLSFKQNNPGYTSSPGWSHELLLRVLIHNLQVQPLPESPEISRQYNRAMDSLSDALSFLLSAQALSAAEQTKVERK